MSSAVALASSAARRVVVWVTSLSAFSSAALTSSALCRSTKGPVGFCPRGFVGGPAAPAPAPAPPPSSNGGVLYRLCLWSQSLARIGATFAVAASLAGLATPDRCWKTTLGTVGVLDLSLILGVTGFGERVPEMGFLWVCGVWASSGCVGSCLLYTSPSPRD